MLSDLELYVTKDKDGTLYLFENEPYKDGDIWRTNGTYLYNNALEEISESDLPEGVNPSWEDKAPIKVRIKLLKV